MKEEAKKLRERGYSYSEIAKLTGKSKRFAWRHSRNIPFTVDGLKRYRSEVKGILKQIKPQKLKLTSRKARVIGHVLFDGCSYKNGDGYLTKYINSSKDLIDQFTKDVKEIYGISSTHLEVINKHHITIYKITFSSKLIFEDLKKYFNSYSTKNVSKIPTEIMNSSKNIKLEFLRAFWEDEGSITANGRLMADQKNKRIIHQLIKLHKKFNLNLKLCKYNDYTGTMYKIYLLKNKDNLINFYNLNLFDKSTVTRGKNIGKKKIMVLKEQLSKF
jgi:hypothetical protein